MKMHEIGPEIIQNKKQNIQTKKHRLKDLHIFYPGGGGALKCNVVSRHDQGFLKYTLNKYFLLKPKYTPNADFTRFLTNFTP